MTVKEAAIEVLKTAGRALTVEEILSDIKGRNLFLFRTTGPRGVLLATMKRHSENTHSCTPAKAKVFRQVSGDRFELIG
ncbi:MAG: hypothetical protein CMO55_07870 [Verrucomicrobiales bacterium]|nr:hypothetical protein [Verrucomicrobiales bacterium]